MQVNFNCFRIYYTKLFHSLLYGGLPDTVKAAIASYTPHFLPVPLKFEIYFPQHRT